MYYLTDGVLYRWDRDHDRSLRVAAIGGIGWPSTTFDGRCLAFVDDEHGPRNLGGHRIAEAVVFDTTTTGRQLVRDATGNGSRSGTESPGHGLAGGRLYLPVPRFRAPRPCASAAVRVPALSAGGRLA